MYTYIPQLYEIRFIKIVLKPIDLLNQLLSG